MPRLAVLLAVAVLAGGGFTPPAAAYTAPDSPAGDPSAFREGPGVHTEGAPRIQPANGAAARREAGVAHGRDTAGSLHGQATPRGEHFVFQMPEREAVRALLDPSPAPTVGPVALSLVVLLAATVCVLAARGLPVRPASPRRQGWLVAELHRWGVATGRVRPR